MLPLCVDCNGGLDRLFEKPAKDPVRRLLRDVQPLTDQAAVTAVARWAVKTLALASHPAARHTALASTTRDGDLDPWSNYPRALLESIRQGDVAADTSLWFALADPAAPAPPDPSLEEVLLRHTSRVDGLGGTGQARTTGFGLPDGRTAFFQLAYHPLHDFEHPFERRHLVTRLWPNPPERLVVHTHPVLDRGTHLAQAFVGGGFCHQLDRGQRSTGCGPPWV